MTEKLGIIAGVVAFLGFSLFCAWHHTTLSNIHHSAETPLASTSEVPATAGDTVPKTTAPVADGNATFQNPTGGVAPVPQTTAPIAEVPATASPPESIQQPLQQTTSPPPPQPLEPVKQEQPSQLPPAPGLRSKVVEFYTDSDIITPQGRETLNAMLPILRNTPMAYLEITGHTDNLGVEEYNLALSQRRADAVKNYFIAHGIAEQSLVAQGYGSSLPIADNATAEGRQHNRRTEIIVHPPVVGTESKGT